MSRDKSKGGDDHEEEDESKDKKSRPKRVHSSKKSDPEKTEEYWTPEEMARAKPRSRVVDPEKSNRDDDEEQSD